MNPADVTFSQFAPKAHHISVHNEAPSLSVASKVPVTVDKSIVCIFDLGDGVGAERWGCRRGVVTLTKSAIASHIGGSLK